MVDEAQFENIFEELKKIQQLEESDVQLRVMYGNQKDEINQVKSELGLDEGETATNKKNVIGGQDAPSRLTSNERNRYKNIGRAFVEGASQSFKNIQKAIKFKENMSTIKNKFFSGIDKIKTGIKNAVGSGDFWKKLLKIIGLLGIIVYLYKEKFSKKFPDLSESVGELFGGLKRYFGGLVSNIYDFVVQGISRTFESILNKAFLYIPSIIDTFFGYTLPTAITNLYLEILSLYGSESAQEELSKRFEEQEVNNTQIVEDAANVAENHLRIVQNQEGQEYERYNKLKNILSNTNLIHLEGEIDKSEDYKTLSQNAGILAFETQIDNKSISYPIINYLRETLQDQQLDIIDMMRRNVLDMNVFASDIERFSKDNNLTKGEVITAIQNSITDSTFAWHIQNQVDELIKRGENLEESVQDINGLAVNSAFSDFVDTFQKLRQDYSTASKNSRKLQDEYELELAERKNKFKPVIVEIDSKSVGGVITDAFVNQFGDVINSISNFIKGDSLKTAITNGLLNLGQFYEKFFNVSVDILNDALSIGSQALYQIMTKTNDLEKQQREGGEKNEISEKVSGQEEKVEQNQTINYGNNNVIVNVNVSGSKNDVVATLIGQLNQKDFNISNEISKSNEHLSEMLKLVQGVNRVRGVTENFVNEKCEELQKNIDKLKSDTGEAVKQTNNRIGSLGNTVNELVNSSMPYITTQIQQVSGFA